jgi:isoamylase
MRSVGSIGILLKSHPDLHRFVKMMVAFRARRDVVIEDSRLSLNQLLRQAQLEWHGVNLHNPDWGDDSHSIAFTVSSLRGRFTIHAMLNAYWEPLTFELPSNDKPINIRWRRWIDTSLQSPQDICPWEHAPIVSQSKYEVAPRSIVLLVETVE